MNIVATPPAPAGPDPSANPATPVSPVDWDHPTDPHPGPRLDHVRTYVSSGGTDGHLWHGVPTLLLTTLDRATGRPVRTPLVYAEDEGRYLVVAADPDGPRLPAWYGNLTAHPEVRLQVGTRTFAAWARTADAVERETYWQALTALWPPYEDYQALAGPRELPLVIVEG
ncbi:nitroreductase family deazaflavin-dependent oxidoreductase [Streptomyces sp. WAC07149]|uniref:nitroreductase family deazaflavin-dependent oxidoreductase n=1 Tax=Streptomyces sp. WAC07149 TaxID=2487425 RepID=UPI000F77D671|nr:nitroreductase family deazaflavin-dependent oxidoreductase [Streptomyces sp. WAC07149]RST06188.1 nitroreductase family deazaflavin-dependent oxidoreductase [Streptomyces sp. WAC07149]